MHFCWPVLYSAASRPYLVYTEPLDRFSALPGLRYVPLVVRQTMAGDMPCQKTWKTGLMVPYKQDRV